MPVNDNVRQYGEGQGDGPATRIQAPILVVDDEEANLVAMRAVLEDLGQPVVCVHSGVEALRLLLEQEFALILLDVLMPGLDGYETASTIRSRQKTRHVPIIFLSAMDRDQTHLYKGYSAGAVDYVFKPVEPQILRSKVSIFIELHIKIQEVRRQAEHEKQLLAENLEVRQQQTRTAQALERSEAQQSLVIQSLPIALYVSSSKDGFQSREFVGGNTENLCGLATDQFSRTRKVWLSRIHDDDRNMVLDALDAAKTTGFFSIEYRWRRADDTYGWFYDRGSVTGSSQGSGEMFGIWLDVSDRRILEQQLAHAQKLEALGHMTGGIAHDFNNMLSVIIGSLEQIDPATFDSPKVERRLDLATQAANSCADLTNRLLGFARRQALEPVAVVLCDEIAELENLLLKTVGEKIKIKLDCPRGCWPVYIDASQLEAALMNLVINARDAMADGGSLTISARNLEIGEAGHVDIDLKPGKYVELRVADTGTGMPEDVREKAFEPFFTTKGMNKGTGLGLSTIYGFVKQSGGTVTIVSQPDEGTAVNLFLPRAGGKSARHKRSPRRRRREPSGRLVLVVDDDEKVREVAVSMLEESGFKTVQAGDGREALDRLDGTPDISLLFSDCVMPGDLDGEALAQEVSRRYPDLPILLTSAYRNTPAGSEAASSPAYQFLPKPYTVTQLMSAIQLATGAATAVE